MSIEIKRVDRGMKSFLKQMINLNDLVVTVGVHKKDGRVKISNSFKVGHLAYQNEFGSEFTMKESLIVKFKDGSHGKIKKGTKVKIPERPFIRMVYMSSGNRKRVQNAFVETFKQIVRGRSARKNLRIVGEEAKSIIKNEIRNKAISANSKFQVKKKGKNNPLVESGKHLLPSINYKVVKKTAHAKRVQKTDARTAKRELEQALKVRNRSTKTTRVRGNAVTGYYRKDGTYVRGYKRS